MKAGAAKRLFHRHGTPSVLRNIPFELIAQKVLCKRIAAWLPQEGLPCGIFYAERLMCMLPVGVYAAGRPFPFLLLRQHFQASVSLLFQCPRIAHIVALGRNNIQRYHPVSTEQELVHQTLLPVAYTDLHPCATPSGRLHAIVVHACREAERALMLVKVCPV